MKVVRLYGEMGRLFGKEFILDVASPAEAIRALACQLEGFKAYLSNNIQGTYKVFVGGLNAYNSLTSPCSDKEVIRFVPVVQGAGAATRVVVGVVLVALAFATGGTAMAAWGTSSKLMFLVGASLIMGGVSELLAPKIKAQGGLESKDANKPSFLFTGAINTEAQGHPVPLAYGLDVLCGSAVASAGITTVDDGAIAFATGSTYTNWGFAD